MIIVPDIYGRPAMLQLRKNIGEEMTTQPTPEMIRHAAIDEVIAVIGAMDGTEWCFHPEVRVRTPTSLQRQIIMERIRALKSYDPPMGA